LIQNDTFVILYLGQMRYLFKTALLALLASSYITAYSQGCKHFSPFNFYALFEVQYPDVDEILKNALALDSVKKAQALLFMPQDSLQHWRNWLTAENHAFDKNRGSIPMITDLNALHPYFRDKVIELIARCKAKGIELAVVETYRTHTKQAEYKTMGKKYTSSGAGKSKHQYGLAVDVVPIVNGKAQWANLALWRKIGVTGERLGLRWGGRWRHPFDPGHFEWTGGLNTSDLITGKEPYIPNQETKYPCLRDDVFQLRKFWDAWEAEQSAITRK
jgi:hypothetical protein